MNKENRYEKKYHLLEKIDALKQNNALAITDAEAEGFLRVLLKLTIHLNMKTRGIDNFENYIEALIKEYLPATQNPVP